MSWVSDIQIDWGALGLVALVSIIGSIVIMSIMSLGNWFLTPHDVPEDATASGDGATTAAAIPTGRKIAGYAMFVLMGLIFAFGIYLITDLHNIIASYFN